MILTRCRDGGTEDPCCSARCDWPLPTPVDTRPANAERLGYLGGAPSVGILSLAPRINRRPHEGRQTEKLMLQSPRAELLKGLWSQSLLRPVGPVGPISGPPGPFVATPRSRE